MTAIGHAELPLLSTPQYGTSLIGLPAAVLLAGLVMLGIRGCQIGVDLEPEPAFAGAISAPDVVP